MNLNYQNLHYKLNYKELAYMISLTGSIVSSGLTMIPSKENQVLYSKYSAIILAFKSMFFIDMSLSDIIHHLLTILLACYYLYYTSINPNQDFTNLVEEIFIVQQVNISSIFLGLRRYKKNMWIDLSFFLTFLYYRTIFVNHYFTIGFPEIYTLCPSDSVSCIFVLDKSFLILSLLNIYWFVFILRKANRQIRQQIKDSKKFQLNKLYFFIICVLLTSVSSGKAT